MGNKYNNTPLKGEFKSDIGHNFQFRFRINDDAVELTNVVKQINNYFGVNSEILNYTPYAIDWAEPIFQAIALKRIDLHDDAIIEYLQKDMAMYLKDVSIIKTLIELLRNRYYVVIWTKPL